MRYKGTKTIAITPDYSEVAKLCDQWLAPKQGTDSALAMAMGHVILKAFHLDNPSDYFQLLPDLHRHADAGDTRAARRRQLYAGPYAACFRPA
nr:molybdopterin-dependent oxidoreductase [Klebsiella pneumoniae subsp. pneumoniae]